MSVGTDSVLGVSEVVRIGGRQEQKGAFVASYQVVCTVQEPAYAPPTHAHIVEIGTGTTRQYFSRKWSLSEVIRAIRSGDSFYTVGPTSGRTAQVQIVACRHCGREIIRSTADAVSDNNLDSLPACG
jgi:hypothetical protein